jgi:phenylpropionate dioxygenase-like ring-hydroxylating dioxygenase large terminal subunit
MNIANLIDSYQPGKTLAQAFYTQPDVFSRDMDLLLNRWTCVGHASEIPKSGDYLTAELGLESAIVARQANGEIRAMANVCRHRGSRVCTKPRGHAAILTCPYHAWTYNLDGSLRQAREMPPGFDPAAHGLIALPITVIGGLIFISFAQTPPALDQAAPALAAMTSHYDWEHARIAHRHTYTVRANWKLAMENYHECYHCGPAHPEFSVLHALARPNARNITENDVEAWAAAPDGQEVYRVMQSTLSDGCQTGSRTGKALAPLMGAATYDGACTFAELGFLSAFLAYPDHGLIYRFIPRGVLETEMEVIWLVKDTAEEGRDYVLADLSWLWDVTSLADKTIIERNQAGVLSRAYQPGPFSLMEPGTRQYVERYVGELAR